MPDLLARYASEFVTFVLTLLSSWILFRITNRRPDVVFYNTGPAKLPIETKLLPYYAGVLTIGNQGRAPAHRVRVVYGQHQLEKYEVNSAWPHRMEDSSGGAKVFVFDLLPPKTWITITYVTTMPLGIPSYVGHEQGQARAIDLMLQRVYPTWFNWLAVSLMILGAYSAVALLLRLIAYLAGR